MLSDKDNVRVSFVKSLFDDHWNQIAFSVRRNTVSFYVNCEFNGKLPIMGKIRPFGGQPATVIVGSTGPHEFDAFQVSAIFLLKKLRKNKISQKQLEILPILLYFLFNRKFILKVTDRLHFKMTQ